MDEFAIEDLPIFSNEGPMTEAAIWLLACSVHSAQAQCLMALLVTQKVKVNVTHLTDQWVNAKHRTSRKNAIQTFCNVQ